MCDCCDYIKARGGRLGDPALIRQYELLARARLREQIRAGGWWVTAVEPEEAVPGFAYTTGLWSRGHAELVIFGLDHRESAVLLDAVGDHVASGARVADGDTLELGGWLLAAFHLPNPGEVVLQANRFYRRRPANSVPAVQLVHPDVHGVWPWEPGCHLPPNSQPMPGSFSVWASNA